MMSDYKINQVLVIEKTPLKIERVNWEQLVTFLHSRIDFYNAAPVRDFESKFIKSYLIQLFCKITKHTFKLANKGKPMNSNSTIQFLPSEKNFLIFIIGKFYDEVLDRSNVRDTSKFFVYLQPILNQFQQFEINNQGLTTT